MQQIARRGRFSPASLTAALAPLIVVATLPPSPAEAASKVYSPIVEEGEVAIEWRGVRSIDSDDSVDGDSQYKLDFEYAPTAWWNTEAVIEWSQDPGDALQATEVAWENVFQLAPQGAYWLDFGVLAEFAHSLEDGGNNLVELGLLGQKEFGPQLATANLLFERELVSGAETEVGYALQYRWRLRELFEPGLELHGELGELGHMGSWGDHEQVAGPAFFGRARTTTGALKYEAGLFFGLTSESPAQVVRVLFEYEFR